MTRSTLLLSVLCVMVMATASFAAAIPNYSFEDGATNQWVSSIPNWSLLPPVASGTSYRVGQFSSFDGYLPQAGNVFTVVALRDHTNQALISDSIVLASGDHWLEFSYAYVTKNVPEDPVHIDPFTVTMKSGATELDTWTVADTDTSGLFIDNSISSIPFLPNGTLPNTYTTGWQTFTVDIREYVGSTVTLEFRVSDSALQGGGTGYFLDNVTITPEPGTFLLFGVGALGLMFYGRRKVRRKRA